MHDSQTTAQRSLAQGLILARHRDRVHRTRQALRDSGRPVALQVREHNIQPVEPRDESLPTAGLVADDGCGDSRAVRRGTLRQCESGERLDGERGVRSRTGGDELHGERERAAGGNGRVERPVPGLLLEDGG